MGTVLGLGFELGNRVMSRKRFGLGTGLRLGLGVKTDLVLWLELVLGFELGLVLWLG